jgi:hypothetical protein
MPHFKKETRGKKMQIEINPLEIQLGMGFVLSLLGIFFRKM